MSDAELVHLARVLRLAKSGEARSRALLALFAAIDKRDGVVAVEVR